MKQDPKSFAVDRASPLVTTLDYRSLIAALSAHQATTRTARVQLRLGGIDHPPAALAGALADLAAGRPGWSVAVAQLAGHFHGGAADATDPADDDGIGSGGLDAGQ